jgi:hypothetical protein
MHSLLSPIATPTSQHDNICTLLPAKLSMQPLAWHPSRFSQYMDMITCSQARECSQSPAHGYMHQSHAAAHLVVHNDMYAAAH